jgi:hypothetical protein
MNHVAFATSLLVAALGTVGTAARAQSIDIMLTGYQEVPPVSSAASGRFKAKIDDKTGTIDYELSYADLVGTVTMGHIHFGRRAVNGGIMVWLCQTATNPDPTGLSPTCPQSGTVTGTLAAANVIGPAAQGIDPAQFDEVLAAIRAGAGYVNVHSSKFPAGEIRGQAGARGAADREHRHQH